MTEIKFRAWMLEWDDGGKMFYRVMPTEPDFNQILISFDGDNSFDGDFTVGEDVDLMQYTGLKDKHGVEIYEGDIVDCERHGFTTSIEYYGGAFRCRSEGVPLSLYIDECYADKDDNNQLEVIGNIYENPELLKESTNE